MVCYPKRLDRYDGYRFKHYVHQQNDTTSISENVVSKMCEDPLGRIWIATENNGLECFDPKTDVFHHIGFVNLQFSAPRDLNITSDGHIWFCTLNSVTEITAPDNLKNLSNIQYKTYTTGENLPVKAESILYPFVLPEGNIGVYTSTHDYLWFDTKTQTWLHHSIEAQLSNGKEVVPVFILGKDKGLGYLQSGHLYIWQDGKTRLNVEVSTPDVNMSHYDDKMLQDKTGNIWLILHNRLFYLSAQSLVKGTARLMPIIETPICKSMILERQGQLWIGTSGYGIRILQTNKPVIEQWLPKKSIAHINEYQKENLIFAQSADKCYALNNKGAPLPLPPALSHGLARSSSYTPNGTFYTCYADSTHPSVTHFEIYAPNKLLQVRSFILRYFNKVSDVQKTDSKSNIWLSLHPGKIGCIWARQDSMQYFDFYYLWNNPNLNINPKTIYESNDGTIWLCTTQGLVEMKVGNNHEVKFRLMPTGNKTGLSSNSILSALDDPAEPDSYLWVGTNNGGLNKMDKKTGDCTYYTKEQGLPDNVIYGILPDDNGNLWLSTNYGLSRFNTKKNYFRNFTAAEDGLQDNEFNTGAFFKHPDGRMFFGGVNGISVLNPRDFKSDTSFAPIFFTELKVNNRPVIAHDTTGILAQPLEFTQKINLKYNQNFLTLSFAALDFKQSSKSSYYYKMEGVDADWVFGGQKTEVNYPNLGPGTYKLYVANINETSERNPNSAVITFVISPPWYRSWLAYLVYALITGGSISSYFQFRLRREALHNELLFKEKEAKKLQELDALKNNFITNMMHEFRTPLTLILEPVRKLMQRPQLNAGIIEHTIIRNNANRLLDLVNQLLDISKIEAGKLNLQLVKADFLPVLQQIFNDFKPLAQKKHQELIWDSELTALNGINDKGLLEKIVYNLLSNAVKFTPEGGTIRLSVTEIDSKHWQLQVTDTGISISESNLQHIFDRFYQIDNSSTRHNQGTGIGLTLVKELVFLAHGTLDVKSKINAGSQFSVVLPYVLSADSLSGDSLSVNRLVSNELTDNESPDKRINEINNQRDNQLNSILLVEDNDEMRQYVSLILERNGYKVFEAANGAEGIVAAKEHLPDIIISDVMMPKKDGYELTRTLKNDILTSHIPIVLLTAKDILESKILGYKRGADAYLTKPFHTEELLVRLQQLLETRRILQAHYAQAKRYTPALQEDSRDHKLLHQPKLLSSDDSLKYSDLDTAWLHDLTKKITVNMSDETFNIDTLVSQFGMSRSQFYIKIKALTGLTPAQFVRNIRLDTAYDLLKTQPDLRVTEVMYRVGLNDVKHFSGIFKEQFGFSPREAHS